MRYGMCDEKKLASDFDIRIWDLFIKRSAPLDFLYSLG